MVTVSRNEGERRNGRRGRREDGATVPFLVERRGQRGPGELGAAGSSERRAAAQGDCLSRQRWVGHDRR
jgi:hypothetical protein